MQHFLHRPARRKFQSTGHAVTDRQFYPALHDLGIEKPDQPHADSRDVGDEKKDERQGGAEGPDVARDPLQGDTRYRRGDKKIRSVGRADKSYGECHGDDDTEVDGVDPEASDDRQEDRSSLDRKSVV